MTYFPDLMAVSARVTHLSLDVALLIWQFAAIFLFLLACWKLSGVLFTDARARCAGVVLIAVLLTLPVAGTALYFMDQYMNPRNLAAFIGIFAIVGVLEKKYVSAGLWLLFGFLIHPIMPVFVLAFCIVLEWIRKRDRRPAALGCLAPLGLSFSKTSPAYHEALQHHAFLYLLHWEWYEWLGLVAPFAVLWWFSRIARAKKLREIDLVCRALIVYEAIFFVAALVVSIPARFESLARLQPTRSLYLVYVFMFLIGGGFLGQYVLKNRVWRWLALFVPLCAAMYMGQGAEFPASPHIEWPGVAPKNLWAQAFVWIRENTPESAVFALDPQHMDIPGEDEHGFRVIAQRSMIADATKDSGAVIMFPLLAGEWFEQVQAASNWKNFQSEDFRRLQARYGVNWVVLKQPGIAGMDCPYQNAAVRVCKVN